MIDKKQAMKLEARPINCGTGHCSCIECVSGITYPWPSKNLSPNARVHWSVKSKATKSLRRIAHLLTLEAGWRGVDWEGDVLVSVIFFPPDKRARDIDNMLSSSKAIFDGLADALGVNDKRFIFNISASEQIGGYVKVNISRPYVHNHQIL